MTASASRLVSRVSGKSFADFTREMLFEPLGMTRTSWRDDFTRVVPDRSIAYDVGASGAVSMDMPFENVHGNGGLLTTVSDLLRWNENAVHAKVGGRGLVDLQRETMRLTSGTMWWPPSSFTAVAPPSWSSRPALRTASSGFAW